MGNEGKKVTVHYVGTLDDGTKFDSSRDRGEGLTFVCMAGQMIPGFDEAVRDMEVGETKTVRIEPEEAYGAYDENLVRRVDKRLVQDPDLFNVGERVVLSSPEMGRVMATVSSIDDAAIVLDLNHELAGKALTFEIELLSVDGE